jgi:hypothetical protein
MYFAFLINLTSVDGILVLTCSLFAQVSHPCNKVDIVKVLYNFNLVCFWTGEGFKVLLIIFHCDVK